MMDEGPSTRKSLKGCYSGPGERAPIPAVTDGSHKEQTGVAEFARQVQGKKWQTRECWPPKCQISLVKLSHRALQAWGTRTDEHLGEQWPARRQGGAGRAAHVGRTQADSFHFRRTQAEMTN